jgi:hypothetical protein
MDLIVHGQLATVPAWPGVMVSMFDATETPERAKR